MQATDENPLIGLVRVATASGEAALVLANTDAIEEATGDLKAFGFAEANNIGGVEKQSFVVVSEQNLKDWYDAAAQWGSGQISYTDRGTLEQKSISIDREGCLVLICPTSIIENEPDLRAVCGAAITI